MTSNNAKPTPWIAIATIAIALVLLAKASFHISGHLTWPHDNNWETQGLDTVKVIQTGQNPYSEDIYAAGPMVYTMYTPLYYFVCSLFPAPADSPYFYSRLISLGATFSILLGIVFACPRQKRASWLAGVLVALAWLSLWPVLLHAAYLKCDTLALALSSIAIVVLARRFDQPKWMPLIALLLIASFWTKQTFISASACALLFTLLTNRRSFLALFVSLAAIFTLFTLGSYFIWGQGFFACLLSGGGHALSWGQFSKVFAEVFSQPLAVILTTTGLVMTAIGIAKERAIFFRQNPYAIYFLIAFTFALLTLAKEGSYINYLLEPMTAAALLISAQLQGINQWQNKARLAVVAMIGLLMLVLVELQIFPAKHYTYSYPVNQRAALYEEAFLRDHLSKISDQPLRVLPFFPLKTTHAQAHQFCLNDSFLYMSMWRSGQLSATPFIASINEGYYDVVMWPVNIDPNDNSHGVTALESIWTAINHRYAPHSKAAGFIFLVKRPGEAQIP